MEWVLLEVTMQMQNAVSASVAGALRVGYRSFDCAACYGNEDMIGKDFRRCICRRYCKKRRTFYCLQSMERYAW
ncbi:MAG: hypothetical protein ACLURP_05495 [Ruminococcus sp.]